MRFNERLLRGVDEADVALAKLILFCLKEDVNLIDKTKPMDFTIVDKYIGHVNKITAILLNNDSIGEDYTGNSRLKLNFPLYVTFEKQVYDIEELRKMWSQKEIGESGKMGDPRYVSSLVEALIGDRSWTFAQILKASKVYLEECKRGGRLIRDLPNFLHDKASGEAYIAAYIEVDNDDEFGVSSAVDSIL